ncbi:MAG TPA: thioredoxin family protein [Ignavibacteriaceae bacterium]|nr:thioredoxin family protein [Ignavibacteriaceae bacterium]
MKRKIALLFLLTLFLIGCGKSGSSDNLAWGTNLESALQKAKKENKAVLVNFTGSDWCQWCFKLSDEVFKQKEFEDYSKKNLILVMVDFPRKIEQTNETKMYNQQLAQQFGIQGFPTILLFNSEGKAVAKTGYQPGGAENYIRHLESYL